MKTITFVMLASLILAACTKREIKRPDTYNYNRAMELTENGEHDEAVKYFKKEIEEHPDNGYAHMMLGAIYQYKDNLSRAMEHANKAIKYLDENDEEYMSGAYRLRVGLYLLLEDTVKAMKDLDKSIRLYPDNEDLLQARAQLYYEQERYDLSDKDNQRTIDTHPESVMGYMGMGRNANAREEYEKALPYFDKVVQLSKDYVSGYAFRADSYVGLKQYPEAADDLVKALDIDINDRKANYLLNLLADSALSDVTTRLKVQAFKDKNTPNWYYCLGKAYEHARVYRKAIDCYAKAIEIDALSVLETRMAKCYEKVYDFNQALTHYEKAHNLDPNDDELLIYHARVQLYKGNPKQAAAEMDDVVERNPDSDVIVWCRAVMRERAGDIDGAIEDLTTVLVLDHSDWSSRNFRATLYQKKGQTSEAISDWKRIIKNDTVPNSNSVAMYAYAGLGQYDKAKKFMGKVIENEPDEDGVYYDAACLYGRMGEYDKALKYLRKSFEKGYREFNHIDTDYDMDVLREIPAFKMLIEEFRSKDDIALQEQGGASGRTEESRISVEVPFKKESGVCKVMCKINDLPLHFIFDTGASTVSISNVEATFMYKNGYIKHNDVIGKQNFVDANGDVSEGTIINLRRIDFGGFVLDNVRASVVRNQKAPLLLGQSVLGRLGKIEIDNGKQMIKITSGK